MAKKATQLTNEGISSDREHLLSNSFYALPDNPSNKNFTASQIKGKGYKPSLILFDWMRRLIDEVNGSFEETDRDLSDANLEVAKIKDGRTTVEKASRDADGNAIASHYETKADASSKLAEAKGYSDAEDAEAKRELKNYSDDNRDTAIQSAKAYADLELAKKINVSEPVMSQMAQGRNAVTSLGYVSDLVGSSVNEASKNHVTGVSVVNTGVGSYRIAISRSGMEPLIAEWMTSESTILDTSKPPYLDADKMLHISFIGGSSIQIDMTDLVDTYRGSVGEDITITIDDDNVIHAVLDSAWVAFFNEAYANESVRIANEETRIANEQAREASENARAEAFAQSQQERSTQFSQSMSGWDSSVNSQISRLEATIAEYGRELATESDIRGLR